MHEQGTSISGLDGDALRERQVSLNAQNRVIGHVLNACATCSGRTQVSTQDDLPVCSLDRPIDCCLPKLVRLIRLGEIKNVVRFDRSWVMARMKDTSPMAGESKLKNLTPNQLLSSDINN